MKKITILTLVVAATIFSTYSQNNEYITLQNIPYYEHSEKLQDAYISERCVLDISYPKDKKISATVVWFHGGGLTGGSKEIPKALQEEGICVVGVNYRLAPKVKSPAYIEDAAAAIAWVFHHINRYGGDPDRIFLSGHSAGGYLIMMTTLDKQYLAVHNIDANRIAGIIPLSGQTITHFSIRKEYSMQDTQPFVNEYAPLYHVRADAPPMLLITGDREFEMLGRYEENAYLARMMKIAGHSKTRLLELQGYGHNMAYPAFPLVRDEIKRILKIMEHKPQ